MLQLTNLHAHYGKSHVLHGVTMAVAAGEIVSLLGRNGSGRSTTVKAIMGFVDATGSARFGPHELLGRKPFEIARLGVGYVAESRDIFPQLTVRQNLLLGQQRQRPLATTPAGTARWTFDDIYAMFPRLAERRQLPAGVLSGGEQQLLALCRTLMGDPDLLLVDEPTEGLAPQAVEQVAGLLTTLRQRGVAVLLVEQKLAIALDVAQRCYVMGHGRIVFEGTPAALRGDATIRQEWLEV